MPWPAILRLVNALTIQLTLVRNSTASTYVGYTPTSVFALPVRPDLEQPVLPAPPELALSTPHVLALPARPSLPALAVHMLALSASPAQPVLACTEVYVSSNLISDVLDSNSILLYIPHTA